MVDYQTPFEALQAAVTKLGSQAELARVCGVSATAAWKWIQSSKRLPAEFVLKVEAATGVSRHQLRPDIYPSQQRIFAVDGRLPRVSFQRRTVSKAASA